MSPARHDTTHTDRMAHGFRLVRGLIRPGARLVRSFAYDFTIESFAKQSYLNPGFKAPRYLTPDFSRPTIARPRITFPTIKGLLRTTAFVALSAIIGVSTAAGSYAFLTRSASAPASTIQAGSLGLTINGATNYSLDGAPWTSLLPGDVVSRQVSVANTGTTPATVTVRTVASTSGVIEVRVKSGACSGIITSASSTTTPTILPGNLAGGASITVCIQVSLTSVAVQNQSTPFTMTFTSDQMLP